jgi:hypothetical protein
MYARKALLALRCKKCWAKKNPGGDNHRRDKYFFYRSMLIQKQIKKAGGVLHRSKLYLLGKLHYILSKQAVGIHKVFYRLATVYNGGMVSAAKMVANGF